LSTKLGERHLRGLEEYVVALARRRNIPVSVLSAIAKRAVSQPDLGERPEFFAVLRAYLSQLAIGTADEYAELFGVSVADMLKTLALSDVPATRKTLISSTRRMRLWQYIYCGRAHADVPMDQGDEGYPDPDQPRLYYTSIGREDSDSLTYNPPWDHEPYSKK
jgi:hypothetical protein